MGLAVLLLSASLLAFEVVLVRLFAVETFHHLTYMAVGLALLGMAASGTVLVLVRHRIAQVAPTLFEAAVALAPVALLVAPILAHVPRFEPTQLLWDPGQWMGLAVVYGTLSLPFFVGGGAIALALGLAGERVGRVYACSMVGSGLGTLGTIPLLILLPPDAALAATAIPAGIAATIALLGRRRSLLRGAAGATLVAVAGLAAWKPPWSMEITQFKALPQVEAYPEAVRVGERWHATGFATAVRSPAFHYAPGLSLAYQGGLPPQTGLFVDGELAGAVTLTDREGGEPEFLDWLPTAASYAVGTPTKVLVLGSGGGTEVLNALAHGADEVVAVELVRPLVELAREVSPPGTGAYADERVSVVIGDARAYVARSREYFDRVILPTAGVFNAAAAGVHSGSEDFLNTVEAYRAYLGRLAPEGILSLTRWTRTPARDNVRAILTMARALREVGVQDPGGALVFVRSWSTGTLLVKPDGFTPGELQDVRAFAAARFFDVDWPTDEGGPARPFNVIDEPAYQRAAHAAAAGAQEAARFADGYGFEVAPATDGWPYFGRFLRLRSLPVFLARGPGEWLPVAEWGTLMVIATLLQSAALAVILLGCPLLMLTHRKRRGDLRVGRTATYFIAIGFGYLFIEIAAIQRLGLILGHPVYATGATLAALLVFSGLGSAISDRVDSGRAATVCVVIAGLALLGALVMPSSGALMQLPLSARATLALGMVALVGVPMGGPFPLGLRRLARATGGVGWAWAANGVASVSGAALAVLISMELGGRGLILAGAVCYGVAGVAVDRGSRVKKSKPPTQQIPHA